MKKYIFLGFFLLSFGSVYSCDACGIGGTGGYIGILPQFTKHFVGIRYQFRYFSSVSASDPASGIRNREFYHTWNVWGRISPHKRVQIFINAPIHYYLQLDQGVKRELVGPGDVWTLVQYQVIRTNDTSSKKMRQSLQVGGGIKLPTGRYNIYDPQGYYDRNMQPGTGSWDFLLSSQYTVRWKGWAKAKKFSVLSSIGVSYDYGSRDIYLHQQVPNSGGQMVSASAGADLYVKRWVIGAEFKMPVYAQMSSGLLNPGPQLMSQLMFLF
jgi:hypothetical protein